MTYEKRANSRASILDLIPENGPELAYITLYGNMEFISDIDDRAPIVGSFTLTEIPQGRDVPEEVQQEWLGVSVPVRFPTELQSGGIMVTNIDAIISLLATGKIEAAKWFTEQENGALFPNWMFQLFEGELILADETQKRPMLSKEFYGEYLEKELREELDQILA